MTAVPVAQKMTADEFLALPESPDAGRRELIDGEVVVSHPTPLHEAAQGDLYFALRLWCRAEDGRGQVALPLDVRLDESKVFVPDLLWWGGQRGPGRRDTRPSPMPDLAVEVRSPSTWRYDIGAKKAGYEAHGLRELWLVDTAAEVVLIFRRSGAKAAGFDIALELGRDEVLESPLLPGFTLLLSELFSAL